VECVWLRNWKRNDVVVHLMAHLNEIPAAEDDSGRRLSWMEKEEEGGVRTGKVLSLRVIATRIMACCRAIICVTQ